MNYYHTIKYLYPEIQDNEFSLQDDGAGAYISKWSYQGAPKPGLSYLLEKENEAMNAKAMSDMRIKRNQLLLESDWTQVDDSPLTNSQKVLWAVYRQSLRDLPLSFEPSDPVWPTPPGS